MYEVHNTASLCLSLYKEGMKIMSHLRNCWESCSWGIHVCTWADGQHLHTKMRAPCPRLAQEVLLTQTLAPHHTFAPFCWKSSAAQCELNNSISPGNILFEYRHKSAQKYAKSKRGLTTGDAAIVLYGGGRECEAKESKADAGFFLLSPWNADRYMKIGEEYIQTDGLDGQQ